MPSMMMLRRMAHRSCSRRQRNVASNGNEDPERRPRLRPGRSTGSRRRLAGAALLVTDAIATRPVLESSGFHDREHRGGEADSTPTPLRWFAKVRHARSMRGSGPHISVAVRETGSDS
jgi:hypothetical protein